MVNFVDADRWHEVLSALKKNPLRTFLTAFGVGWGIFLLMVMLGTGKGLENSAMDGFGDFATNSVFMWSQRTTIPFKGFPRGRFYNFNNDDTEALINSIPEIELIAPRIQARGYRGGGLTISRLERSGAFPVYGTTPDANRIDPVEILNGRFINQNDINERRKVIIIGTKVYNDLFETGETAIGEYIKIQGAYYKIIGLFKSKNKGGQADRDNQSIHMPLTTLQKTFNYGNIIGWYAITSHKNIPVEIVEQKAKTLLASRHHIHPDDKRAIGSFNLHKEFKQMTNLFVGINGLIWIVGIGTLLAGVIGVSNIMLIIVKERTREIGIQRAIGATPWNIISQIITESVLLTTIAGYFGMVAGIGLVESVNYILIQFNAESEVFKNPEINFSTAIAALILLIISGIFAGFIPAKRAVSIRPVEAIRNE
ncbi:ABC transporter permease [Bacteroidota bacterium]